jgi:lipoprotein-anchoring transpeptidase ErfK/SrfK
VGLAWIGLNKKGIGIHGTNNPDSIGRSASHGCIRLANWDAVQVLNAVTQGVTVEIK